MKCPNCHCEIGNLTTCPYCGVILYRRPRAQPKQPTENDAARTTQPVRVTPTKPAQVNRSDRRRERHLANCDTWGLLCVILISGVFILELLQLLAILL